MKNIQVLFIILLHLGLFFISCGYHSRFQTEIRRSIKQPSQMETYDKITENAFYETIEHPRSTFGADVDVASYANSRRFIRQGKLPPKDAVRVEEFINYFSYDYAEPAGEHPVSICLEYGDCPWNTDHKLLHIGLKAKSIEKQEASASNLVFLIDVSGSMNYANKLPLLKQAFRLLVDQLGKKDKISIVVYASREGLVLPPTSGKKKAKILEAINNLSAGGSTAGGAGIRLAYKVAEENFIKNGNNRIILATDGDFNVGVSSTSELVRFVEEKRQTGIFLTILGFGEGNIKDARLEQLTDHGNGQYAYIDNLLEARKVLVNEIGGTLYTVAKDVKIQVEFNPAKIKSYRLIGYENRVMDAKDFDDDKKDSGDMGAGHTVTALYELVPAGPDAAGNTAKSELKYTEIQVKDSAFVSDEKLTVRFRYKHPKSNESQVISTVLTEAPKGLADASDDFVFSAAAAQFAMLLRDSPFKSNANYENVISLAGQSIENDEFGYKSEFLFLVKTAKSLAIENSE